MPWDANDDAASGGDDTSDGDDSQDDQSGDDDTESPGIAWSQATFPAEIAPNASRDVVGFPLLLLTS